jgi:hypothetical protein
MALGVTNRCSRSSWGSRRTSAASIARSAQSNCGRGLVRRSTATSCRSTSNSTSLAAEDRPSRTSQLPSRTKIRYSSRNATPHDHALEVQRARSSQLSMPVLSSDTPQPSAGARRARQGWQVLLLWLCRDSHRRTTAARTPRPFRSLSRVEFARGSASRGDRVHGQRRRDHEDHGRARRQ